MDGCWKNRWNLPTVVDRESCTRETYERRVFQVARTAKASHGGTSTAVTALHATKVTHVRKKLQVQECGMHGE